MSFIRVRFRGPFLHKDWPIELLRALQIRFHHSFYLFFSPRKEIRIHLYGMREAKEIKPQLLSL